MRLLKRAEYEAVYGAGQRRSSPQFSVFYRARRAPLSESSERDPIQRVQAVLACPEPRRTARRRRVRALLGARQREDATPETLAGEAVSRFGISVKKTLGRAVVRNRIRRRIREILRRNKAYIPKGWDIVIHPRPSVARAPFAPLEAELVRLLRGLASSPPRP